MKRRSLIKASGLSFLSSMISYGYAGAVFNAPILWPARDSVAPVKRVRPGDPTWPSLTQWQELEQLLNGKLIKLESPLKACVEEPQGQACHEVLGYLNNAFYIGDQPALSQTSGWVDAWMSQPSSYAVAAENTADVVAAINFARTHNLRLVVKGGGHSYQGTSTAPDSLLVWTRQMNDVVVHDNFIPAGCKGVVAPQPAVSLGAGAMWIDAYHAVTTQGGRYVQGGGCTTVGVAGLVQSGGFSNFSKRYGTAAASLLEAEVVTADGKALIANACSHADLFWALKGGGGGSFGVVTRLTLRTHELPDTFGAVFSTIQADSDQAFRRLIAKVFEFYAEHLFNPHWGEQIRFHGRNSVEISMVFQGLSQSQVEKLWAPFHTWVSEQGDYTFEKPLRFLSVPAQHFWDWDYHRQHFPQLVVSDPRPHAKDHHILWEGDQDQAGWFIHGFESAWLPAMLLDRKRQAQLVDAVFAATRHWSVGFHFNKGLAGAGQEQLDTARDTATNPAVLDAFALVIIAGGSGAEFAGLPREKSDLTRAREHAVYIKRSMNELLKVAPTAGSYVSESNYFNANWQREFWGDNYEKLLAIKTRYDPEGLFFVRHGVGSEGWSDDGFTRL